MNVLCSVLVIVVFNLAAQQPIRTPAVKAPSKSVDTPATKQQKVLFPINVGGMTGYIDRNGEVVISPRFKVAGDFSEGLAIIEVNGKFGFIDNAGNIVIAAQFAEVRRFKDGRANVKVNGRWGYIDRTGRIVIPPQFRFDSSFSEGLAPVDVHGTAAALYIDLEGKIAIPARFVSASPFNEGLAAVEEVVTDLKQTDSNKQGYINRNGRYVIQPLFDSTHDFSEGLAAVKVGGKWGFIDKSGAWKIKPQFESAWRFSNGLAEVKLGGKWGYIDRTGTMVIAPKYWAASRFSEGVAMVAEDASTCGYISEKGTLLFKAPEGFACGERFQDGVGGLVRKKDMALGYINKKGEFIWPKGGDFKSVSTLIPEKLLSELKEASTNADPNATTEGKLSAIGVITDIHRVNLGIPCPFIQLDGTPVVRNRGTQNIQSCDWVFSFNGLDGQAVAFLFRGITPPVSLREICRIRFQPGKQYAVRRGYGMGDLLKMGPDLPRLLNVEEVSPEDYQALISTLNARDRAMIARIPKYKYSPGRTWR